MSRYSRLLILERFLDKLPENLFFLNERILVSWEKLVGISLENLFEDKSMIWRSRKKLKSVKVLPKNLLFNKSNNLREEIEAMDSGTFPEKLLPFNIRAM